MKLADIDALKQTFCAECDHSIKCEDCDIDYHFEHLAPTVDAIEVVRCKDCLYRDGNACDYSAVYVRPNGFCQWGERREDETN